MAAPPTPTKVVGRPPVPAGRWVALTAVVLTVVTGEAAAQRWRPARPAGRPAPAVGVLATPVQPAPRPAPREAPAEPSAPAKSPAPEPPAPSAAPLPPNAAAVAAPAAGTHDALVLPGSRPGFAVDWPAVLQLANASGVEVRLAEERVREAQADLGLAQSAWLPSLRIGLTQNHHDGRIQLIEGPVINANKNSLFAGPVARFLFDPATVQRDVLRARSVATVRAAGLERTQRQHVQDAALAFVDLQGAQAGNAVQREVIELLSDLLRRVENYKKLGSLSPVDVKRFGVEVAERRRELARGQYRHRDAGLRLAQLLGLDLAAPLYAADEVLVPLALCPSDPDEELLVAQAQAQGPGLAEVDTLLRGLDQQMAAAKRTRLYPTVGIDMGYGTFGGGVGSDYRNFNDRLDVQTNVYWDLSDVLRGTARRRQFESKQRQAVLQREELQTKLELGVRNACNQIRGAADRFERAKEQIETARQVFEAKRKIDPLPLPTPEGRAAQQQLTLGAVQAEADAVGLLAKARGAYLEAVLDYNRAQVTLRHLVGDDPATAAIGQGVVESSDLVGHPVPAVGSGEAVPTPRPTEGSRRTTPDGPALDPSLRRLDPTDPPAENPPAEPAPVVVPPAPPTGARRWGGGLLR